MRLLTAFLAILILAALGVVGWVVHRATQDTRDWNALLALADKDFPMMANYEEQVRALTLVSRRLGFGSAAFQAWKVLVLEGSDGKKRVAIVEHSDPQERPVHSSISVSVYDESRRLLSRSEIPTGWMTVGTGLAGIPKALDMPAMFFVETATVFTASYRERELYALVGERPMLVRVEDLEGRLLQNDYAWPDHSVGPPLPLRSPADWEEVLRTSDVASLLRVLVWLGGAHAMPESEGPNERPEEIQRWQDTLARKGVRARLAELARHPHPWVAEAARGLK